MKVAVTVVALLVLVTGPLVAGLTRPDDDLPGPPAGYADATTTWLELLAEAVPDARRVSILVMLDASHDRDVAAWSAIAVAAGQAARRRALRSETMTVRHRGDLLDAFVMMTQSRIDGVVVLPTRFAFDQAVEVAALAIRHRLPLIGGHRRFADSGALMSYGICPRERASAMPAGQPTRFELVISARTARALGLTIHPSLRRRADLIIE